ncbi:hypothetical protein BDB00DRAFT_932549 [Zychaea mexicana]|uniref:uncharacterized protein n=1 Tax=Zychaea mexicana TaxID=64656 RepID=UPI0022FF2FE6|nr:uncharacterized protein BDB00DRAFT_932549 [Zychaea mexicana]KAI9488617.1 hypothetical protein BDB00DRAFT_932549 [Zychaea mexicana]
MTKSLQGKVAVLTGASRNIGKAVATELVKRGAKVVIGDVLDAEGEATVKELNTSAGEKVAAFIHTDVTQYSANRALFALAESEFGGVDIAFLNAGIGTNANTMFLPMDDAMDDRMLDINTTGVVKGTKVAMLHLAKRGGGVIVNTASVAGFLAGPTMSIYNASKHGVIGWTRSCAIYQPVCNVRVNAVCPTWVDTDLAVDLAENDEGNPFTEIFAKMPRVSSETVVEAVLTLIEDESRNTQTLLALPGGVIRPQEPVSQYPELVNDEFAQIAAKRIPDTVAYYKRKLEEARKREGI